MTIAVKKLDIVRNTTAVDSVSRKDQLYSPFSCQLRFFGHQLCWDQSINQSTNTMQDPKWASLYELHQLHINSIRLQALMSQKTGVISWSTKLKCRFVNG